MSDFAIQQVLAQIRSLSAQASTGAATSVGGLGQTAAATAAAGPQGASFGEVLKQSIDSVNQSQRSADALSAAWERGDSGVDLARVMIETQKAQVSFRALTEVRNRLVSAYQDIMNMSI